MLKNLVRNVKGLTTHNYERLILEKLAYDFGKEIKVRLKELNKFTDDLTTTQALHSALDNLTNIKSVVQKTLLTKELINSETAITLLDEQIEQTKTLLQNPLTANSSQVAEIGVTTLNYLFCAKQKIKQKFSLITKIDVPELTNGTGKLLSESNSAESNPKLLQAINTSSPRLVISSIILHQMKHSLFPAEKMLVGAGHRNGEDVMIDAVFEVTGEANAGHVWADRNRLSQALISMSETDTYFALWIHSHPGNGSSSTYPSQTDLDQEKDWLKDYSKNLVNAIMVKDGFLRFWGKSIQNKQITVCVEGVGVKKVSETEYIYKLDY
jgi:proteasome lid subunit RPN8/RPN11